MKIEKKCLFLFLITFTLSLQAENTLPKDTTKVVDIEEIVVIASPKETGKLRNLPTSVSLISQHDMQGKQITSLKSISGLVPNFFMPDYGSRITSAIYIRGIGARINTPAVGLYVDNIPYIDKSAFDFNFFDIERIDILRGPQGTLYGRNTMGGLIKVHTRSPFTYQGTDLKLSAGTYNQYNASVTHYHRISDRFAFSAGGFYEHQGGFFENNYKGEKADPLNAGGGRMRTVWLPSNNLKLDFSLNYEYTDQGGYAYGQYDKKTQTLQPVSYNDPSTYRRGLMNAGLNIEYQAKKFVLSAVTGYQNLNDRMAIDQDFTEKNIFTLVQKQKLNSISEEVIFRSKPGCNWQWTTGAFGFYQWLNTDGPVTFKDGFMSNLQSIMDEAMQASPVKIKLGKEMMASGNYNTPLFDLAVYHQSTFNNLIWDGLSLTVGLRLDYEKTKLSYSSDMLMPATMERPGMPFPIDASRNIDLNGKLDTDYLQLLPKFSLQYTFDNRQGNIYATVSRGYRSGGYNIQMFSDILQGKLQGTGNSDNSNVEIENAVTYKPEFSWNYELGTHLTLFNNRLQADLAGFLMDTRDQQISRFAPSGLGRMTMNAGKSRSFGAEAAFRASVTNAFSLNASYGFTKAQFTDYISNLKNKKGDLYEVDYQGNYVPMIPKHTLSVGGEYIFLFDNPILNSLTLNVYYTGAGKIYWTEQNDVSQSFYGTLNGRISAKLKDLQVDIWGRNLTNKHYATFYFESMNNGFMQRGKPIRLGVDLRYKF